MKYFLIQNRISLKILQEIPMHAVSAIHITNFKEGICRIKQDVIEVI